VNAPPGSAEALRQSTTRVTSTAPLKPKHRPRDYRLVEKFRFDNGREPQCGDGPPYWALLRVRTANLIAQATAPRQSGETDATFAWRTKSAARMLVATAKTSAAARQIVKKAAAKRSRETSSRRRRGDATSLGGDSGDPPRPSDDDVARPRRASQPARKRSTDEQELYEWRASLPASDLSAKARLVAFTMSVHWERNGGTCSSSVATLARETALSYRAVQYALAELDRAGFVERERGGRGKPTRYRRSSARGALVREASS
jgi:hypothetical protein